MGQIKYITAFFMIAIFSVAVISYMVGFANDNNAEINIGDDPDFMTYSTLANTTMAEDYYLKVNSTSQAYQDSEIDLDSETTNTGAVFKDGGFNETYHLFKGLISLANNKVFGGEGSPFAFVLTAFVGFLLIIFVLLSWKTWKGGNPE